MRLPLFIAKRYLFAKRSYNIINIISLISAIGIALGAMALIVVLSVYNGFGELVESMYNRHDPDLVVLSNRGKHFSTRDTNNIKAFEEIRNSPSVAAFCEVIEENVFLKYGEREAIVTIKGIDSSFIKASDIEKYMVDGEFFLSKGEERDIVIGKALAIKIGARSAFTTPINLYFPSRTDGISIINPLSSLNNESLYLSGIYAIENEFDSKYVFTDIDVARDLLEYQDETTSIELYINPIFLNDISKIQNEFSEKIGEGFIIKNRYQQNEDLHKMIKMERLSIYLILTFIILIISCNLISSLAMLIIEKKGDIETLLYLGAKEKSIKMVFLLDGWLISLIGMATGLILGVIICIIQQQFGIVQMPGSFIVEAYPVVIKLSDLLFTAIGIASIGLIASLISIIGKLK